MTFIEFNKLNVWLKGKELVRTIYLETKNFPKDEVYGLTPQVRRAAISIISNIAEGCGRSHTKDKLRFFFISRGSLFEVEAQIRIARSLGYINETVFLDILKECRDCQKLLNGFITYHKNTLSKHNT